MPAPIQHDAANLNLSSRVFSSATVAGSPALAAETIVCQVTCPGDIGIIAGFVVMGWCAFTVGTSGVSVQARLRRATVAGTLVQDSGATNEGVTAATQLGTEYIQAFDPIATAGIAMPNQVYVLTLQVASGSAPSTVSAASLICIAV